MKPPMPPPEGGERLKQFILDEASQPDTITAMALRHGAFGGDAERAASEIARELVPPPRATRGVFDAKAERSRCAICGAVAVGALFVPIDAGGTIVLSGDDSACGLVKACPSCSDLHRSVSAFACVPALLNAMNLFTLHVSALAEAERVRVAVENHDYTNLEAVTVQRVEHIESGLERVMEWVRDGGKQTLEDFLANTFDT